MDARYRVVVRLVGNVIDVFGGGTPTKPESALITVKGKMDVVARADAEDCARQGPDIRFWTLR